VARALSPTTELAGSEQRPGGAGGGLRAGTRRALCWAAIGLTPGAGLAGTGCQKAGPPPGPALAASAATPAALFPLGGTAWRVEEIEGRLPEDRAAPTLAFDGSRRVNGSTGCNRYFAPLTVGGSTLEVGQIAATRMACPPAILDQEGRFVKALAAVRGYRLEGATLWLLDAAGRTLLRLVRA
jgi:heat shock protein HslJ